MAQRPLPRFTPAASEHTAAISGINGGNCYKYILAQELSIRTGFMIQRRHPSAVPMLGIQEMVNTRNNSRQFVIRHSHLNKP